jgi:jumonji domain-containing protein 7
MLQASHQAVEDFAEDVKFLWCPANIPVLEEPPSALEFLRDYVSASRPCIIRNAICEGNKALLLTLDDLVASTPDLEFAVDVSPDGNADVLRLVVEDDLSNNDVSNAEKRHAKPMFVQPEERRMSVAEFQANLRKNSPNSNDGNPLDRVFPRVHETKTDTSANSDDEEAVFYYSRQNDCLRTELAKLWRKDIFPPSFPWAEEAFGTGPPQAVNRWIGTDKSTSSMHKDHYENLFYVLSGEKVFTLCPPADAPFLYEEESESGRFHHSCSDDSGRPAWAVQQDTESDGKPTRVRWIAADVTRKNDPEHLKKFPLLEFTHPIEVKVQQGQMLYLPSLWFHRVTQNRETVGVNYWYDMKFCSPLWSYFHFLQQLEAPRACSK